MPLMTSGACPGLEMTKVAVEGVVVAWKLGRVTVPVGSTTICGAGAAVKVTVTGTVEEEPVALLAIEILPE